jgi:glucose 1-dehydrogenase
MSKRPVCLITGASSGIGAATAVLAAERGYDLMLSYNSDLAGAEHTAKAARAHGARVDFQQADVADAHAIASLFDALDAAFGRIDALVNNAGIVAATADLTQMDADRLMRMFQVNVIGAMLVAKEAVLRMKAQGEGGVVVNVSSVAARLGSGNQYVDYAASKAAIDTFTKGLSDEVAAEGIRVMSLRPGLIETPIHEKGGEPGRADRLAAQVPMRRKGTADEVARGILWLLSDEASYVTGSTLDVSGGR